jgi:hypothetical protein
MSFFKVSASALPFLQSLIVTNQVKSPLVSMAVARVISQYAPLPDKDCGDYSAYFTQANAGLVAQYLDSICNIAPLDFKAIQDYAVRFYNIRCENAIGCCQPSTTGTNGVYNLFHIGTQLSGNDIELIKKNSRNFTGYVCGFEAIYKDMQSAYTPDEN